MHASAGPAWLAHAWWRDYRNAGDSLVRGAGTTDAIVMASASLRGDIVYSSDPDDLTRLQAFVPRFSNVRVMIA